MIIPTKTYEKPQSGIYHALLADIVDLGLVTTTFKGVSQTNPMVRFVWVLDVNDSTGKPLQATERFNVGNYHEKSNIYKRMKQILGTPPDVRADIDGVIGVVRRLVIQRDTSADGTKDFANITGILPAEPGKVVPLPVGFVQDRQKPVQEQAKYKAQTQQPRPQPAQNQTAPTPKPTSPTPVQQLGPESFTAKIAELQALLAQATAGQAAKTADVSFSAPSEEF